MSQRPHLGSIFQLPGGDYLSRQTGHAATGEKKAEVQKRDLKPFPPSFNTLLFTPPHTPTQPAGALSTVCLPLSCQGPLLRGHSLLRPDLSRNLQVTSMLSEKVLLIL